MVPDRDGNDGDDEARRERATRFAKNEAMRKEKAKNRREAAPLCAIFWRDRDGDAALEWSAIQKELSVITVFTAAGTNEAEEAVTFVANTRGKEQMILVAGGAAGGEAQSPQAVDGHWSVEGVAQLSDESAAGKIEDADVAVSEIAD